MIYRTHANVERIWYDEFDFIEWLPNFDSKRTKLSKKKLLKRLSELNSITDLHILLLDNLSKIFSILYYPEDQELLLNLESSIHITVKAERATFNEILMSCAVKKE